MSHHAVNVHDHSNCGHDHGHSHGGHGGHSHGRGGKGKKGNDWKYFFSRHGFAVRAFNYVMDTNILFLDFYLLLPTIHADNNFEYWFNATFMIFIYIMAVISMYRCSNIPSTVAEALKVPPDHSYYNKPKNDAVCKVCETWKPNRAHHCSVCKTCTLKMDHHCPWIDNCVGANNHKAFSLYCVYMALGSLHFIYKTCQLFYHMYKTHTSPEVSVFIWIYLMGVLVILVPIGCMLTGLMVFHPCLGLNNMTTLEQMGNVNFKSPCNDTKNTNVYDTGYWGNFLRFWGTSYLWFWWPEARNFYNDGTYWENNAIAVLPEYVTMCNRENPKIYNAYVKEDKRDFSEIFEKAEKQNTGKHMQFNEKIYEFKE